MSKRENHKDFNKIVRANLISVAFAGLLGPMAPELAVVLNVNIAEIGLINSVFLIVTGIFSLIWGIFADRTKRKELLITCSLIWVLSSFITIFINDFLSLLILQIIAAIGLAGIFPISYSILIDLTKPEKRSHALGIVQMAITLGMGLGIILSGVLIDFLPWWVPFLLISLFGFKNIHSLLSLNEPQKGSLDGLIAENEMISEDLTFKIKKEDFKEIIASKSNLILIIYTLVKSLSIGAINFFFIAFLKLDIGLSSTLATLTMIGSFSIMLIGAPYLGKKADHLFQERKTGKVDVMIIIFIFGPIFYILGFSLNFVASDISLLILFIFLILIGSFFMSGDAAIGQSIFSDIDPPQIRSTLISIQSIAAKIGQSLGILLLGYSYIYYGNSFKIGFLITNLILLSCIAILIPLRKTIISDIDKFKLKYKKIES
ncbi:MAG: MFS transporter [Promethearchaeota archaeon]